MKPGKQSDIVKEFGVSRNAISLLVKAKDYRIIKTPGGKIDIDATVEALRKSGFGKRSELIKRKKGNSPEKPDSSTPTTKPATKEEIDTDPLTLESPRDKIERHKAFHQSEKVRIENEEKQKKLIEINTLTDRVFSFVRQFSEHQQNQKDRIGSKIEAAESRHEIERIIEDDNHQGLSAIASNFDELTEPELKKKILSHLIR